jgi:hypothetical protein
MTERHELTVPAEPDPSVATIEDFENRHGQLAESEVPQVTTLLADASALILNELAEQPEGWFGEERVVPAVAVAVCVQIAYRAWTNPDGIASEMLGEASRTYRGDNQADALWITENEKKLIRRAAGKARVTSIAVETPYGEDPGSEISPLDFWPIDKAE